MVSRKQCKKCPWKVGIDPYEIPHGYSEKLHEGLVNTIAAGDRLVLLDAGELRMMACHESMPGSELPCVGWMHHQQGVGNNLALRIAIMQERVDGDVMVDGPQHECFEDTLPK